MAKHFFLTNLLFSLFAFSLSLVASDKAPVNAGDPIHLNGKGYAETVAKSDLTMMAKHSTSGYRVEGFLNRDSSLRTLIRGFSCFGPCPTYFDGTLTMYNARFKGKKVIELRDHADQSKATTIIRLVPGEEDQLIKLEGKYLDNQSESSMAMATMSSKVSLPLSEILKNKIAELTK